MYSLCPVNSLVMRWVTGKPLSAISMLGPTTCSKLMVPYRSRAVSQASQAEGTTLRPTPMGIVPSYFFRKTSGSMAMGQRPSPEMLARSLVSARWTNMGATPAKLVCCGEVTFSAMPAATPASTALPPASSIW